MRSFFAVEIPEALRRSLSDVSESLGPVLRSARFVVPANLHLTVRFLGETEPEVLEGLLRALEPELSRLPAFELSVSGLGAFPDEKRPRVLWAGIPDPPEAVQTLARIVETFVVNAGFAPEARPFTPHLTLARFRKPERGLARAIAPMRARVFGTFPVDALTSFESRLSPKGATYRVTARLPLALNERGRR